MTVRCGVEEVFCNLVIKFQSFSVSLYLDCKLQKCFSSGIASLHLLSKIMRLQGTKVGGMPFYNLDKTLATLLSLENGTLL